MVEDGILVLNYNTQTREIVHKHLEPMLYHLVREHNITCAADSVAVWILLTGKKDRPEMMHRGVHKEWKPVMNHEGRKVLYVDSDFHFPEEDKKKLPSEIYHPSSISYIYLDEMFGYIPNKGFSLDMVEEKTGINALSLLIL